MHRRDKRNDATTTLVIPTWDNAAEHGLFSSRRELLDPKFYPDFGGCGVDVTKCHGGGKVQCREVKCQDATANPFSARTISLPFTPPNNTGDHADPCLESSLVSNKKRRAFEASLRTYKRKMTLEGKFSRSVRRLAEEASRNVPFTGPIPRGLAGLVAARLGSRACREHERPYAGGCLAAVDAEPCGLLLYPSGATLGMLAVSLLGPGDEDHLLEVKKTVRVRGGCRIYQLAAEKIDDETYCVLRTEGGCRYIRVGCSLGREPSILRELRTEEAPRFAVPSGYVPGELLFITRDDELNLRNCRDESALWRHRVHHEEETKDRWWQCFFGSHPRCIIYADALGVYRADAREPAPGRKALCSVSDDCFLDDRIGTIGNSADGHQHYVATSARAMLWDERYWTQPVVTWSHSMRSSPTFLHETLHGNDAYVVLGAQKSREVAIAHVLRGSCLQPTFQYPPWHPSRTCDFVEHLDRRGAPVPTGLRKRATAPLIGARCILQPTCGLVVLQLTSQGDLFYQDFTWADSESLVNGSWKFGPGYRSLVDVKVVAEWQTSAGAEDVSASGSSDICWTNMRCMKEAFAAEASGTWDGVPQLDALRRARQEERCVVHDEWTEDNRAAELSDDDAVVDDAWDGRTTRLLELWKTEPDEEGDALAELGRTLEDLDVSEPDLANMEAVAPSPMVPAGRKKRKTQDGF